MYLISTSTALRCCSRHSATRRICRSIPHASFRSYARPSITRLKSKPFNPIAAFAGLVAVTASLASTVFLDAEVEPTQIDPDTNISFPKTLVVPSKARFPPFELLGVGVRTVSFLGLKVYSVGFYADMASVDIPADLPLEEKVRYIIANTACAIRIVPTRSTSYTHLRDSFIRTLQARLKAALKAGTVTTDTAEDVQSPLRTLKSLFPNSPFAKNTSLDIILTAPPKSTNAKRAVVVRDLGVVENDWIAQELFLAYFEGNGISPPMKNAVLATLHSISVR